MWCLGRADEQERVRPSASLQRGDLFSLGVLQLWATLSDVEYWATSRVGSCKAALYRPALLSPGTSRKPSSLLLVCYLWNLDECVSLTRLMNVNKLVGEFAAATCTFMSVISYLLQLTSQIHTFPLRQIEFLPKILPILLKLWVFIYCYTFIFLQMKNGFCSINYSRNHYFQIPYV